MINLLWDVIAAKGFEKDTYFEKAARDIRGLPKLEGTVHVNMALVLKFMPNYLFNPAEFAPVAPRREAADDPFLFAPGAHPRPRQDPVPRLAAGVRRVRRRAQRGAVPRAGRGAAHLLTTTPRRGPAEGPGLPADRRRAVHAGRLRPADPGAGPAGRRWTATWSTRSSTCSCATSRRPRVTLHGQASASEAQREWALAPCAPPPATTTASGASGTRWRRSRARTRCAPRC